MCVGMKEKKLYLVRTSKLSKGFLILGGKQAPFLPFFKKNGHLISAAVLYCAATLLKEKSCVVKICVSMASERKK